MPDKIKGHTPEWRTGTEKELQRENMGKQPKPDGMMVVAIHITQEQWDNALKVKNNLGYTVMLNSDQFHSLGYYKLDEMEIDKDALTKRVSEWFGTYDSEYIKDAIIDLIKANPIKPKTDKESEVGK